MRVILLVLMLAGCESAKNETADDRGMRLRIHHECYEGGSLQLDADGTTAKSTQSSTEKVDAPSARR